MFLDYAFYVVARLTVIILVQGLETYLTLWAMKIAQHHKRPQNFILKIYLEINQFNDSVSMQTEGLLFNCYSKNSS